jgi:hypothetical protein
LLLCAAAARRMAEVILGDIEVLPPTQTCTMSELGPGA